jgi:hypothetical protein
MIDDLPFDLRPRRIMTFFAKESDEDKSATRAGLAKALREALQSILILSESVDARLVTVIDALLEELEYNKLIASADSQKEQGGQFIDDQYKRLVNEGIFAMLDEDVKKAVREAYIAMGLANQRISAAWNHPKSGDAWAQGVNEASRVIINARAKIEAASMSLQKKLQA